MKKKKVKENLEKSYETALLSRKLATIDRSVPLEYKIEDLRVGEPDTEVLATVFRELEFRDLLEQFSQSEGIRGEGLPVGSFGRRTPRPD